MGQSFKDLHIDHARKRISSLKENDLIMRPKKGWIRFIREALNMSSRSLAHKLKITAPSMSETEKAEVEESITLKKLRRVADELNCDLVYYLLPREDIDKIINDRAHHVAEQHIRDMAHSMELEGQAVKESFLKEWLAKEITRLKQSKKLWDE